MTQQHDGPSLLPFGELLEAADEICRDVAELPDRTSPEDWPEAMLVTGSELHQIVTGVLIERGFTRPTQPQAEGLVEELEQILPLLDGLETGRDCEEYAYATGNGFQAMTYCPSAFEALRCIPKVIAALRSSEPSEGWQPIETFSEPTALSSGNGVLIADAAGQVGEAYFRNFGDDDDGWWWVNTSWGDYPAPDRPAPTHWRPLPAPPSRSATR